MVTTQGSRSQLNSEGAALLGMCIPSCSAPLSQSQEDAPTGKLGGDSCATNLSVEDTQGQLQISGEESDL